MNIYWVDIFRVFWLRLKEMILLFFECVIKIFWLGFICLKLEEKCYLLYGIYLIMNFIDWG